eukprot:233115-Chlamydomonas_euryale.AAC.1
MEPPFPLKTHTTRWSAARVQVVCAGPIARSAHDSAAAMYAVPAVLCCVREWTERLEAAAALAVADAEAGAAMRRA